jgi:putative ABC transport system permease protein
MFKNYLKITLAVMQRRKFFTFISLFGISITLTILVVLTSFYEHMFSAGYPEANRDRSLYAVSVRELDTKNNGARQGPMSLSYVQKYLKTLKTPEKVAFTTEPGVVNLYGNGKKLKLLFKYADPLFWEVTQFDFLEGKPFVQQDIDNNAQVGIITDQTRDDYFGKGVSALGKTMEVNGQETRIIGVIRGCPITRLAVSADLYLPYNMQKSDPADLSLEGTYFAIVLAHNPQEIAVIQSEYAAVTAKVPLNTAGGFKPDQFEAYLGPYFNAMMSIFFDHRGTASRVRFFTLVSILVLLFMSLPAINLVNLNISRIMERSSEIGIRKAFGASGKTLIAQFVVENVIITVLGGVLALVLSAGFIFWFNHSDILAYADLTIDWTVAAMAFLLSLVFGLLSGVYPAWRMSRLPVVEALKS